MNAEKASTHAPVAAPLTVIHVPFRGDSIDAVHDGGRVWVSVSKLCEALGLGYSSQLQKLKEKPWATVTLVVMVAEDGKNRSVACLDLDSLPMWLATIDTKRVAPAAREKLVVYQRECARVLREHFFGARQAEAPSKALPSSESLPPLEFFLPADDAIDLNQLAYHFGPRGSLKVKNLGMGVRRSLAIREGSDETDDAMMLGVFQADLSVLGLALDAITNEMSEGDDLFDEVHAAREAAWNAYLRLRGYRNIRKTLKEAKDHAEAVHSESYVKHSAERFDERLRNPAFDASASRFDAKVALDNAKARQELDRTRRAKRRAELAKAG